MTEPVNRPHLPTGRTRKQPPAGSAARIQELAERGASKAGLAAALGVSRDVLRAWLGERPELAQAFEAGRGKIEVQLVSKLLEKALTGDTVSLLFALKCMFGWREGDQGEQGNRVSIVFQLPGAMSMADFGKEIGNGSTDNRDERVSTQSLTRT